MEGGLSVASKLFRHEAWVKLLDLVSGSRLAHPLSRDNADQDVTGGYLEARIQTFRRNEVFALRAETTGTMISTWSEPNGSPDALQTLISVGLPLHKEFFVDVLGYSGSVVIAGRSAWTTNVGEGQRPMAQSLAHPALVQVDGLADRELEQSLHRAANRSRGWWDPEP